VKQPTRQSLFLAGSHELPLKSVVEWVKAQGHGADVYFDFSLSFINTKRSNIA
jgi:hypothetical protein